MGLIGYSVGSSQMLMPLGAKFGVLVLMAGAPPAQFSTEGLLNVDGETAPAA